MICLIVLPNPLLGLFAQVGNETSREGEGLAAWIGSETSVATHEILANFGPAIGAADGLWIASPSAGEWEGVPDYYVRIAILCEIGLRQAVHLDA
jgi:hypothetical protein